jgi:NAD+ diphosphatase
MLQTPDTFTPHLTAIAHPDPITLIFRGDELLLRDTDLRAADTELCAQLAIDAERIHPVGSHGDTFYRSAWVKKDTLAPSGYSFHKLRPLVGVAGDHFVAIAGRAFQIAEWARTHRYCGACASPMTLVPGERCMKCSSCGMAAYPRISPAMMVLIRKDDKILLAKHAMSPTNRYSALAGFLEAGESAEEAVHREVFEEVGLKVHNLRYFNSQSWPFPHSLMIAYTADYLSGEIRIDEKEIVDARWFGPDDSLPDFALNISIAGELIKANLPGKSR